MDKTRVNKFLSQSGFCSRREADKLIIQGRVTVNNNLIDPGYKVKEEDIVKVDGEIIKNKIKNFTYIAFNKPKGIVCTTDTEREEKNIIDFINYKKRIFPIGRLDKLSEGLIFLTDDGDIVNRILRSRNNHEKEYLVTTDKKITKPILKKLENGEYDAIILSKAGLISLEMDHEITEEFTNSEIIPSAGQGTIAVQCRDDDHEINEFLKKINHHETSLKVKAEREVLRVLDGDCETAVGAFSEINNNEMFISGELFSIDGRRRYYYKVRSETKKSIEAGKILGNKLKEQSGGDYKK